MSDIYIFRYGTINTKFLKFGRFTKIRIHREDLEMSKFQLC